MDNQHAGDFGLTRRFSTASTSGFPPGSDGAQPKSARGWRPAQLVAVVAAVAGLLAGCSSTDATPAASSASATASGGTASPSASPSSTLTAAQLKAVKQATEAIRAYEQTFYDILADPTPRLNDMNNVTTDPQLTIDLKNLETLFARTVIKVESAGPVAVSSVEVIKTNLGVSRPSVVLEACVDSTRANGKQDGKKWTGPREAARYQVVKTAFLPKPGWAVAKVLPPHGHDQPTPC